MTPSPTTESITTEFKTSFNATSIETLVAFANTKGGTVYIGVGDGDLTIEDLKTDKYHSSARNKLIVEAFFLTRDIEKYGTGFHRIRSAIKIYPSMKFNYEESQSGFLTELTYDFQSATSGKGVGIDVGKSADWILSIIEENPNITNEAISQKIGISKRSVERNIGQLKKEGVLVREGGRRYGYWKVIKRK